MKNLFTILFLFGTLSVFGQNFRASCTSSSFTQDATTAGLDTYSGTLSSISSALGYNGTNISIGDVLVTTGVTNNDCRKYKVTAATTGITSATVTVQELANYNAVPFGTSLISAPTTQGLISLEQVSTSGITAELAACAHGYNMNLADSLVQDVTLFNGTPTGTPNNYQDIAIDSVSNVIYINGGGVWVAISGGGSDGVISGATFDGTTVTITRTIGADITVELVKGVYDNDADAAANGVLIGEWYEVSSTSDLGTQAGDLRRRKN